MPDDLKNISEIKGFQISDIPKNGVRSIDIRDSMGLLFSVSVTNNNVAHAVYRRGKDLNISVTTHDDV